MIKVQPDIQFKKELTALSGSILSECIQCGNCSAVCSLAPDDTPFPRKEMIWAAWGLKDKLIGNVDVWLCHQCGDCSVHCPRGVKPADVFSATRELSYRHYAKPKFLGKILSKPAWLPVALLIPVVIITVILLLAGTLEIPEGPIQYSKFFPHAWLNGSFSFITLIFYGLAIVGLSKFWNDLKKQYSDVKPKKGLLGSLFGIAPVIASHSRFSSCGSQKVRKLAHFLVFYGFILLIAVTLFAIYASVTHNYPLEFKNPFKITGDIAGLMVITGLFIMMGNRLFNKKTFGKSTYADWAFLISIFLLTVSGFIVETARFHNWTYAYHLYFFHLVSVWYVIMYLPFTKFGHILYRAVAMSFANSINR